MQDICTAFLGVLQRADDVKGVCNLLLRLLIELGAILMLKMKGAFNALHKSDNP